MSLERMLSEIKERAEKATQGPWLVSDARDESEYISVRDSYDSEVCWVTHEGHTENSATFIAHARTDIPRLLAVIDTLIAQRNHALIVQEVEESREEQDAALLTILTGEAKL